MKRFAVVAGLALAGAAQAEIWNEVPDAGSFPPGQHTVGFGPLAQITGVLGNSDTGIDFEDLYCIRITNSAAFTATTENGAAWDTQLWLFRPDGIGVTFNDDIAPQGAILQSRITGQFVPSAGVYVLGISAYDNDPTAPNGDIWLDTPFDVERAPDGPGAPGPLTAWDHGSAGGEGAYSILLTGAEFCEVPAPATVGLLGLAVLWRRRRR